MPVLAEKNDCSEMKKLSKEYLTCTAKSIKAAANKKNKQIKEDIVTSAMDFLARRKPLLRSERPLMERSGIMCCSILKAFSSSAVSLPYGESSPALATLIVCQEMNHGSPTYHPALLPATF